jgi:hypothetical protein
MSSEAIDPDVKRAMRLIETAHNTALSFTSPSTSPSPTELVSFCKTLDSQSVSLRKSGDWLSQQPAAYQGYIYRDYDLCAEMCYVWNEIYEILSMVHSLCEGMLEEEMIWGNVQDMIVPFLERGLCLGKCKEKLDRIKKEGKKNGNKVVK